jgi:nucleoside-diphosphate-sugar epimerase
VALGLVGAETVKRLASDGIHVVATDLDTPANRKKAQALPANAQVRWADLTDDAQVQRLIADVSPQAIIHLAAAIPPGLYRNPALARRVNVDATANLIRAAEAQQNPPRFLLASSNAVWGSRNPHRCSDLLTAEHPVRPTDLYGRHKADAEKLVKASSLDWVVLRLAGVISVDPKAMPFNKDALFFQSCLPSDGRVHMVDIRDVATAFAHAITADVVGETLLIGGDDSHKLRHGEVGPTLAAARGMTDVLPRGLPGNPDNDDDWFVTDWMDTTRAQEALGFQHHSWADMIKEMHQQAGRKRYLMRLFAPLAHAAVSRQGAYHRSHAQHADPWSAIQSTLGDPRPDHRAPRMASAQPAPTVITNDPQSL